jgi:sugar/nucleoside kinase (ribokinase family)
VKTIIVAGHVCVDLTPALDMPPGIEPGRLVQVGPLTMSAGGCVGNTGAALAALGVATQLVAEVGQDRLGAALTDLLAASGADASGISGVDGRGTSYSIVVDVPGRDRTFWHHIGANADFVGAGVLERIATAGSDGVILHLGYPTHLPGLYAEGGAALIRLVGGAHEAGAIVSLDMAEIDPVSGAAAVDWESLLARTLPAVGVVKASVDDLVAMLPGRARAGALALDPLAWADALIGLGAAVALVTAGARGLFVRTGTAERIRAAAPALADESGDWIGREIWASPMARRIVTTTGAGDTAAAGFLRGLAGGLGPEESASISSAAAAARISGRPVADAFDIAEAFELSPPAREWPPGWRLGPTCVYLGPRDKEV